MKSKCIYSVKIEVIELDNQKAHEMFIPVFTNFTDRTGKAVSEIVTQLDIDHFSDNICEISLALFVIVVFENMFVMCFFTVCSEIYNSSAIS